MGEEGPPFEPKSRYESMSESIPVEGPTWSGQVTVCFSHAQAGWVLLWVATTVYVQHITLYLSDAWGHFLCLFDWLAEVEAGRLPAEVVIDEEGQAKTLQALPAADGEIWLRVLDHYGHDRVLWGCRVNREQLIGEIVRKFDLFLRGYIRRDGEAWRFEPGPWGVDLERWNAYREGGA